MYLKPPLPTRQYLISPPSSPPVGWEPRKEAAPIVNYDLVNALLQLRVGPEGASYEIEAAHGENPVSGFSFGFFVHLYVHTNIFVSFNILMKNNINFLFVGHRGAHLWRGRG